jgi:hypothetical protein
MQAVSSLVKKTQKKENCIPIVIWVKFWKGGYAKGVQFLFGGYIEGFNLDWGYVSTLSWEPLPAVEVFNLSFLYFNNSGDLLCTSYC